MSFLEQGYAIHPGILTAEQVARLREAMAALPEDTAVRRKRSVYGARHLLDVCPEVRELAASSAVRSLVTPILGECAFAVRAIFFDKVPGANWSLFWHQDNVIAVKERRETDGFVGWSKKSNVWQVQPPAEVLSKMVAVRLHLDDCFAGNGALRVIPGSHRSGWLDDELDDWKRRVTEVTCEAGTGDAVLMCPLTLHASAPSEQPTHRRVIHIEYAAANLPRGLEWHDRVR
ncbi:MAG: phytanoyl-CoA dioxygenase family protein [Planctomycetota bacterium]